MKELDLLLEGWVREQFDRAAAAQRSQFEALLALPDPQLACYLLGADPAPPELVSVIEAVLANARIMSRRTQAEPSARASL
jgi:succinate dehydrogenase flavin-adding protein (antitoxin of CptAB toxin-antitoxin module)